MTALAEPISREVVRERPPLARAERLRLLVVDDHPAVRHGLRDLLQDQRDFVIVGLAASAEEAMSIAELEAVDVAIVDYQLGRRNGLWLSRKLKRLPEPPKVIVYSAYCHGPLAASAVVAQADAVVSKACMGSDLTAAIRTVACGRSLLPQVPWQFAEVMRRTLDPEEQAIFGMLLARTPCDEIAQTLRMSSAAVESRLWEMLSKLEVLDGMPAASRSARGRFVSCR
jgi:DNA-binding NarL/FixJ family response regulator